MLSFHSDKRGHHYYFKSLLFLYDLKGKNIHLFNKLVCLVIYFFLFFSFFEVASTVIKFLSFFFFWRATFQYQKVVITTSLPSSVYFKLQTVLNIWPLIDNARPFSTWYLRLSEQNKFSNEKFQNHVFRLLINTTN